MRISYNWLKEFIDFDLEYRELIKVLTMIGLESEKTEKMPCEFSGVVVGKCVELDKRDKGNIVTVEIGDVEYIKVYCTAPNVKVGMLAPYAPPGALIKGIIVEKKPFGDFESNGVLCSSEELGIGRDSLGVLPLGDPLKVGDDLASYLFSDDPIELELVSNRGDQYSFLGVARELAVHLDGKVQELPLAKASKLVKHKGDGMNVRIDDLDLCPLYTYRMINDVAVQDSPTPLLRKLISLGLKPVNNIVDITNIVLYEIGQPLHPFDRKLLKGKTVIVRRSKPGEKFTTLDDVERSLDKDDLLIADESGGIALGGVMGGLQSEINWNTKQVLLESALFDKTGIRRTSRRHALRTDASIRFQHGVDPDKVIEASDRVCWYIEQLGIGNVSEKLVYAGNLKYPKRKISVRIPRIQKCLGYEIPGNDMERILTGLGFNITGKNKTTWKIEIPNYRADVEIEEDIAEEVVRHHGYNEIPSSLPRINMGKDLLHEYDRLKEDIRKLLVGWGLYEVITFALGNKNNLGKTHFLRQDAHRVDILNPLTEDHACLRTNLEETMLDVLASNYKKRANLRNIFEIGKGYWKSDGKFAEKDELCIIMSSEGMGKAAKIVEEDQFLKLKGLIIQILDTLKIRDYKIELVETEDEFTSIRGDAFVSITTNGTQWGYIRLVPAVEMDKRDAQLICASATLDWESLLELHQNSRGAITLKPLPRFPSSKRDLALVVPQNTLYEDIEKVIRTTAGDMLTELNLFDIYRGQQVEKGFVSYAINLTFQDMERTLTDEMVDERIESILKALETELNVRLRDK